MNTQQDTVQGMDRAAFLARVRAGLRPGAAEASRASGSPSPVPPRVAEEVIRRVQAHEDLPGRFEREATAAGMAVYRVPAADLLRRVVALASELGLKRIATAAGSLPQALGLNEALRRKGIGIVHWRRREAGDALVDAGEALETADASDSDAAATPPAVPRAAAAEDLFETDAAITDVHCAIAETGSLVCAADAGHGRALSLVPPVHIAIVRRGDIVPELLDAIARLASAPHHAHGGPPATAAGPRLPASVVLITGPSKTADIEGELIVGVHGPGMVIVLLIDDA